MKYVCKICGKNMASEFKPRLCPFCGAEQLTGYDERCGAVENLHKMNALIPKLEQAWENYGKLNAEYEAVNLELKRSLKRGSINADEIPSASLRPLKAFREESVSETEIKKKEKKK